MLKDRPPLSKLSLSAERRGKRGKKKKKQDKNGSVPNWY
jgi:hypothetical protein